MAYYAIINEQNTVIAVNTGVDEMVTQTDTDGTQVGGSSEAWEQFYTAQLGNPNLYVKQTSYNNSFCGCYAGIGYSFDPLLGEFVPPPAPEPVE